MLLCLENVHFPPLQPEHAGRSGQFQLFRVGNVGLGERVATNNHFAVLPHPIGLQVGAVLAGLTQRFPGGLVGDDSDPQSLMLKRRLERRAGVNPSAANWPSVMISSGIGSGVKVMFMLSPPW